MCPNTRSSYDAIMVLIRLDVRSVHIICFGRFSTVGLILSTISRLIHSRLQILICVPPTDIRMRESQLGTDINTIQRTMKSVNSFLSILCVVVTMVASFADASHISSSGKDDRDSCPWVDVFLMEKNNAALILWAKFASGLQILCSLRLILFS